MTTAQPTIIEGLRGAVEANAYGNVAGTCHDTGPPGPTMPKPFRGDGRHCRPGFRPRQNACPASRVSNSGRITRFCDFGCTPPSESISKSADCFCIRSGERAVDVMRETVRQLQFTKGEAKLSLAPKKERAGFA